LCVSAEFHTCAILEPDGNDYRGTYGALRYRFYPEHSPVVVTLQKADEFAVFPFAGEEKAARKPGFGDGTGDSCWESVVGRVGPVMGVFAFPFCPFLFFLGKKIFYS
jgi:hypothetical protein